LLLKQSESYEFSRSVLTGINQKVYQLFVVQPNQIKMP